VSRKPDESEVFFSQSTISKLTWRPAHFETGSIKRGHRLITTWWFSVGVRREFGANRDMERIVDSRLRRSGMVRGAYIQKRSESV